jgi:hypothetical protein
VVRRWRTGSARSAFRSTGACLRPRLASPRLVFRKQYDRHVCLRQRLEICRGLLVVHGHALVHAVVAREPWRTRTTDRANNTTRRQCFEVNAIHGSKLLTLTMDMLPKLNIRDFDHMREIMRSLRRLKGQVRRRAVLLISSSRRGSMRVWPTYPQGALGRAPQHRL